MKKKNIKSFLGTGWSFPPSFEESTEKVVMVSDEEDIVQSLRLILTTFPGERLTNPDFGCDLRKVMFNLINPATEYKIKDIVEKAVLMFEPRIDLNNVEVDTRSEEKGIISIKLTYTVRKVNIRTNVVFPFYKVEGTDIVEVQ